MVTDRMLVGSNGSMSERTDDETLNDWAIAAQGGDRRAARLLIEAIRDPVYRLALRMLGHPADAEDAAQETLVALAMSSGRSDLVYGLR